MITDVGETVEDVGKAVARLEMIKWLFTTIVMLSDIQ